jgi:ElaB/YqjD/DUF883 family membrane-anchored ribosome-binding protein
MKGTQTVNNRTAVEALHSGKEKLSKEIGGMVDEASDLLKNFSAENLESARATLSKAQTALADGAKQYADLTDEYVRANPWKTLGVAAAAGLLVGILLARR